MHGYTPLHFAAVKGNFEVFKLIFDNAETKIPLTDISETPLELALKHEHRKLCEYMLEHYKENVDYGLGCTGRNRHFRSPFFL